MNKLLAGEIVDSRTYTTPYVYKPYPKWVTLADGSQIIVNNEEEHLAASPQNPEVPAPASEVKTRGPGRPKKFA